MDRTKEVGLKLNPNKCMVKSQRIKFFGNILTHKGLEPDPSKVTSIINMTPPTNVTELQSLLGMANYLGRFTPNLATITSCLRDLTKKDVIFSWGPEHQAAFKKLKEAISATPTLAYFNHKKEVTVQTDASMRGLGATLMQNGQPVAYASKSLTDTERNYCNIEREMLGVVFGLERFHHYIYGRHITIETDHKPLEAITKKHLRNAPPRLMRMLLRIQKYDFTVKYIPGREIPVADGLSRLPVKGEEIKDIDITIHDITCTTASRLEKIRHSTQNDKTLNILTHIIAEGWPETHSTCPKEAMPFWNFREELVSHNGVVLKGNRVIIPKEMQREILDKIHTGHQGIEKCRLRARESVFWCGINSDIDNMVKQCSVCQHNQVAQQQEPLIPIEASKPWDIIGSDLFHWNGHNYLLVVDYYSSYVIIRKLTSITSQAIVSKLKIIFSEFGIPNTFISDNGKQYDSDEFRMFTNTYNFKHTTSSPRYPQCNGKAERFVGITKKALEKSYEAGDDPALALLCLRTTPLQAGMPSPAEIMFGRKIQANLPVISTNKYDHTKFTRSTKWYTHYNQHAKPLKELQNGQSVRVQDYKTKKWKPAIIDKPSSEPRSYLLTTSTGAQYRRNRRHIRTTGETFQKTLSDDSQDIISEPDTLKDAKPTNTPPLIESPKLMPTPTIGQENQYVTRSGRTVNPPKRLDL